MAKNIKNFLILYIPVIHKGYINLLNKYKSKTSKIYLINSKLINELSEFEPAISALTANESKKILKSLGFENMEVLNKEKLIKLNGTRNISIILVNDELSRNLVTSYLKKPSIKFESVFLRWDREEVFSEEQPNIKVSTSKSDKKFMNIAYQETEKSSDWWRQVGAVLVKNSEVLLKAYNRGLPDDHTSYQIGNIRDYLKTGERPELSPTIHAEQMIISLAAQNGISTKGTTIYVTHFPCSVCAKLIAASGIKKCVFHEGSSNADGEIVLKSAKVKLYKVN